MTITGHRGGQATHTLPALILLACAPALLNAQAAPARAWQDTIELPTYEEGEADPIPQFAVWTNDVANYPYPLRTRFTKKRSDRLWRTLNLENEYLACRVLPDLGGHLYNCRDKRNGREVFYANPVVKPGPVGLRGAWVAMGIEVNFPRGHSRDTTSPVDFGVRTSPEGAASAIVECTDRISGMQWRVEYRLHPGSTVLEMDVVLYNRSAVRQSYHWWSNAAVAADDPAPRFIVPTRMVTTHGRSEIETWPISSSGRDESLPLLHNNGAGWFAYGSEEPFFAVWKPASRSGLAHFADPAVVSGKKVWRWGTSGDVYVRQDLTDNFPSYLEIQSGLMENQETFDFLSPEQVKPFRESWIPIYDMNGVSRVTPDAIASLQRRQGLELEIGVTHSIKGAAIKILAQDRVVFETSADLDPAAVYRHALEKPETGPYTVRLADSTGTPLLEYTEGVYKALAPDKVKLGKQTLPDWSGPETEAFLLKRGNQNELQQSWKFAASDYAIGLRKFPASVPMQKAKGRLALELYHFQEAADLLTRVLATSPQDEETAYLLAVSQAMLGHDAEARKLFSQVAPASALGKPAALQLAFLSARTRDYAGALGSLKPLLADTTGPVRPGAIETALLRRADRKQEALDRLAVWRTLDPADTMLRFEATRLGKSDDELWTHLGADAERVLNLVDEYLNLGLPDDALLLLDRTYPTLPPERLEPGAVVPGQSPLIAFYRAYCRTASGGDGATDLRAAVNLSLRFAFPNRPSSFRVLQAAVAADPKNPAAHFLLGRLYLNSLLVDEAIAEWRAAMAANGRFPEVYRDLGRTLLDVKKDTAAGMLVLREGAKLNPNDAELRAAIERSGQKLGAAPTTPANQAPPPPPADVPSAALLMAMSGRAGEAVALFTPKAFPAQKQPDEVRRAFVEARLQRLLSGLNPATCVTAVDELDKLADEDKDLAFTFRGFDKHMKEAHYQYYMGWVEQTCKAEKSARKRWTKVARMTEAADSPESVFPLLAAMRLNAAEAKPKIEQALEAARTARAAANAEAKFDLMYKEGALLGALGRTQEAAALLQEVVQSAKSVWLQYLAGVELRRLLSAA